MIYEYRCTNCEETVIERQQSMKDEVPVVVQTAEKCPVCGGHDFGRVWSVPHVPFKIRTGRDMTMRDAGPPRDKHWKKRVMGEKYDGR